LDWLRYPSSVSESLVLHAMYVLPEYLVPQRKGRPRGTGLPSAGRAGGQGLCPLDEDEIEKVESRDESWWEVDVTCNRQVHIIFTPDGVGCCKNNEGGNNASLGDVDGLLFLKNRYSESKPKEWKQIRSLP
jgi:hypothetical protein